MRLHRSILCTKEGTPLPLDSLAPMRRRAHQASALLSSPRPSGSKPLSPASPGSGRERIREGECGLTETTRGGGSRARLPRESFDTPDWGPAIGPRRKQARSPAGRPPPKRPGGRARAAQEFV